MFIAEDPGRGHRPVALRIGVADDDRRIDGIDGGGGMAMKLRHEEHAALAPDHQQGRREGRAPMMFEDEIDSISDPLKEPAKACESELRQKGLAFTNMGWDWYHNSLELFGVPADTRLSQACQKIVFDAGFSKCYLNHRDAWETHYEWELSSRFAMSKGWRVRYLHKSGESYHEVEEFPERWPKLWLEIDYVRVKG